MKSFLPKKQMLNDKNLEELNNKNELREEGTLEDAQIPADLACTTPKNQNFHFHFGTGTYSCSQNTNSKDKNIKLTETIKGHELLDKQNSDLPNSNVCSNLALNTESIEQHKLEKHTESIQSISSAISNKQRSKHNKDNKDNKDNNTHNHNNHNNPNNHNHNHNHINPLPDIQPKNKNMNKNKNININMKKNGEIHSEKHEKSNQHISQSSSSSSNDCVKSQVPPAPPTPNEVTLDDLLAVPGPKFDTLLTPLGSQELRQLKINNNQVLNHVQFDDLMKSLPLSTQNYEQSREILNPDITPNVINLHRKHFFSNQNNHYLPKRDNYLNNQENQNGFEKENRSKEQIADTHDAIHIEDYNNEVSEGNDDDYSKLTSDLDGTNKHQNKLQSLSIDNEDLESEKELSNNQVINSKSKPPTHNYKSLSKQKNENKWKRNKEENKNVQAQMRRKKLNEKERINEGVVSGRNNKNNLNNVSLDEDYDISMRRLDSLNTKFEKEMDNMSHSIDNVLQSHDNMSGSESEFKEKENSKTRSRKSQSNSNTHPNTNSNTNNNTNNIHSNSNPENSSSNCEVNHDSQEINAQIQDEFDPPLYKEKMREMKIQNLEVIQENNSEFSNSNSLISGRNPRFSNKSIEDNGKLILNSANL